MTDSEPIVIFEGYSEAMGNFLKENDGLRRRFANMAHVEFKPLLSQDVKIKLLQCFIERGEITVPSETVMEAILAAFQKPENEQISPRQILKLARDTIEASTKEAQHARITARQERFKRRAHSLPKPEC